MKRTYWIITVIFTLLVVIGGVFVFSKAQRTNTIRKSVESVDVADMNYIKAALDLYYTLHGNYPTNTNELVEGLPKTSTKNWHTVTKRLKEFSYSVRGDKQAYKITYINYYGEKKKYRAIIKRIFISYVPQFAACIYCWHRIWKNTLRYFKRTRRTLWPTSAL